MAYSTAFLRPDLPQHTIRFLDALPHARPQAINEKAEEINVIYGREWDLLLLGKDPTAVGRDTAREINDILSGRTRL
jgi:hypothetical protein